MKEKEGKKIKGKISEKKYQAKMNSLRLLVRTSKNHTVRYELSASQDVTSRRKFHLLRTVESCPEKKKSTQSTECKKPANRRMLHDRVYYTSLQVSTYELALITKIYIQYLYFSFILL